MEAGSGAKRLAWGVIAFLACAFCYSIGFQLGWSEATVRADDRLLHMTESMQDPMEHVREGPERGDEARFAGDRTLRAW